MKGRTLGTLLVLSLLVLVGSSVRAADLQDEIITTYTLGDLPLASVQNAVLPNSITTDRGFLLGGIGSSIWHGPTDAANEYWMITDRGPNGQIRPSGATSGPRLRTFPVENFDPLILHVRTQGSTINVLETIPIVDPKGVPVTGLPNISVKDEDPYTFDASTLLPFNPSGLDTEGIVRTKKGEFWLVDEYRPSIVHLDATGHVLRRYIPQNVTLNATYPVSATLPAIFDMRKANRGFEDIAISADETTLYAVLQSPLSNPTRAAGEASRNTRILVFDIATGKAVAEYVYRFGVASQFDPQSTSQDDMKSSGLIAIDSNTLLVEERTDLVARVYRVDLSTATNILGSKWDDPATSPSLEELADPASESIVVLPKELTVDLEALPGMPNKIEGMTIVGPNTLAVANDNDFNVNTIDGTSNGPGDKSTILLIKTTLPLARTTISLPIVVKSP